MRLLGAGLSVVLALLLPVEVDAKGGRSGRSGHSSSKSQHHHQHHGGRVFVGGTYFSGYYPYGVPLYPAPGDWYWYYCRAANTYYPYIQDCPGGWERHLPELL